MGFIPSEWSLHHGKLHGGLRIFGFRVWGIAGTLYRSSEIHQELHGGGGLHRRLHRLYG